MSIKINSQPIDYKKGIEFQKDANMDNTYYLPFFSNPIQTSNVEKNKNNETLNDTWETNDAALTNDCKLTSQSDIVTKREDFTETPRKMKINLQAIECILSDKKRRTSRRQSWFGVTNIGEAEREKEEKKNEDEGEDEDEDEKEEKEEEEQGEKATSEHISDDSCSVVSSLIEALDELGIEVELKNTGPDTQPFKEMKTPTKTENMIYPDLRELKIQEGIQTPMKDTKKSVEKECAAVAYDDVDCEQSFSLARPSYDTTETEECENRESMNLHIEKVEMVMQTPPSKRKQHNESTLSVESERIPSSPIIASSSKKFKYTQRRTEFTKKANLEAMINLQTPKCWKPSNDDNKPSLESTRKIISNDDLTKKTAYESKLDNTISTISTENVSFITDFSPLAPIETEDDVAESIENGVKRISSVDTLPSIVENFLGTALGSEADFYDTIADDNHSLKLTESIPGKVGVNLNMDVSGSIVTDKLNQTQNDVIERVTKQNDRHNGTLGRTRSLYRSLSLQIKKVRNKLRRNSKESSEAINCPISATWSQEVDKKIQHLLEEITTQHTIVHQASKALRVCLIIEEFLGSQEHVESERILLLALLRKQAAMDEIERLASKKRSQECYQEQGEITVKNISLALREDILQRDRHDDNFVEWFVVVVHHKSTVLASQPVKCRQYSTQIDFPDSFTIPRVTPDFKIDFKVYSLKMQKTEPVSHESKYRIRTGQRKLSCPTPKAIFQIMKKSNIVKQQGHLLAKMYQTSFTLCGSTELYLHDLSLTSPWPLNSVPTNSHLRGTLNMTFMCKVNLRESHLGFVTHGTESGGFTVWNRRWCVFEGHILKFWDYPQDNGEKEPLLTIDLIHCVSSKVSVVERALCAKPRTILIETACPNRMNGKKCSNQPTYKIRRNFLACDTTYDLHEWLTKMNRALAALCEWNAKRQLTISQSEVN